MSRVLVREIPKCSLLEVSPTSAHSFRVGSQGLRLLINSSDLYGASLPKYGRPLTRRPGPGIFYVGDRTWTAVVNPSCHITEPSFPRGGVIGLQKDGYDGGGTFGSDTVPRHETRFLVEFGGSSWATGRPTNRLETPGRPEVRCLRSPEGHGWSCFHGGLVIGKEYPSPTQMGKGLSFLA